MKTYRILGILWLAFCCYYSFNECRALLALHPTAAGLWVAWFVLAGFFLVFMAGIVASIFLFRGARWARWFIGLIAIFVVFSSICVIVTLRLLPMWTACSCVFALVSLVLLFSTRQKPVA